MRLSRLLFLLAMTLLAALPLHALAQGSPFQVIVPVQDTSEAQRDDAFGTALGQVLARVSGGQDLRGKSGYADAIKQAPGLVQQYQYQQAQGGLSLLVNFDGASVQRLAAQLGASTAGLKPPLLLLISGSDGALLGQDALAPAAQAAAQRGYQVTYPSGSSVPDLAKLAQADPAVLAQVSQQYHTGLILLGKLKSDGADWTLVAGGKAEHWSDGGKVRATLLSGVANAVADKLGQQLNVIGGSVSSGTLWISGIRSAMDYAQVQALLRADPSVSQVNTMAAQGDGMSFSVKSSLPLSTLAANLAASGHLLQASPHDGADASLRWLH